MWASIDFRTITIWSGTGVVAKSWALDLLNVWYKEYKLKTRGRNNGKIQIFIMIANNSAGLLRIEENLGKTKVVLNCPSCAGCAELSIDLTQVLLDRFQFLLKTAPYHSFQWPVTICYANRPHLASWPYATFGQATVSGSQIDKHSVQCCNSPYLPCTQSSFPWNIHYQSCTTNMLLPFRVQQSV